MKTSLECVSCFVKQVIDCSGFATRDEAARREIIRRTLMLLSEMDYEKSPPETAMIVHRMIRQVSGNADPYIEHKRKYNEFALGLYPELKSVVALSPDPLSTAIKLAIAGNIIDFGIHADLTHDEVLQTIQSSMDAQIDSFQLNNFRDEVKAAKTILYLGDNTGEIVFDKLFIEELPVAKITFVVKGSPILNDALLDDANEVGISRLVRVINNGSDAPGTVLENCSEEFRTAFAKADMVISKGQGNFETLNESQKPVYFLLKAKCMVVARHLGCSQGTCLFFKNPKSIA